jgi:uncharacterized YccA/Bax inhibitor family protein
MCIFAKYKNIFGKPGEGIHKYRILDVAIMDVFFTLVIAFLLSEYVSVFRNFGLIKTFCALLIFGIFMHRLFDVRTTVDKIIFGKDKK